MNEFFKTQNGRKLLQDISKASEALVTIALILSVVYAKQLNEAKGEK